MADNQEQNDELEITVAEDVTETPDAPAPATKPAAETESKTDFDDSELAQYSENVQKRIKRLSRQRHEERRARESVEKDKEEALRLAQAMWNENQQLKDRLAKGETVLAGSVNNAATAELETAKRELKEAMEAYDAEKIVEAQEKLNRAVLRTEQAKQFQARTQRPVQAAQPQQSPPPMQPPPQRVDPKAAEWQSENSWFGDPEHEEMTAYAVGLHNRLTRERGAAYASTEEYYEQINARIRETFPSYFGGQGTEPRSNQRPATVVAPATRSVPPKSITLTKRQADIARRLNVPLDLYAKQLAALENGNG